MAVPQLRVEPTTSGLQVRHATITPPIHCPVIIIIIIIDNRGLNARWCLTPFLLSLPTAAYLGQRGLTLPSAHPKFLAVRKLLDYFFVPVGKF